MGPSSNAWSFLLTSLLFHLQSAVPTHISICHEDTTYEYPLDQCPGGIQIRNVDNWFSKSRGSSCICGEGATLQFDGPGKPWHEWIYPLGFPPDGIPYLGSWVDYNLKQECELLQGERGSALFIDARKYVDPQNLPSNATELIVIPSEPNRLVGSFAITVQRGTDATSSHLVNALKTAMFNTHLPVLINTTPEDDPSRVCAYHPDEPQIVLTKYIQAQFGFDDSSVAEYCEKNLYPPYERTSLACPATSVAACHAKRVGTEDVADTGSLHSFQTILELMAEVAVRMKFAQEHLDFNTIIKPSEEFKPYLAMLQRSARVFYRGFPDVIKWETLMSALTIFGTTFDGLIPHKFSSSDYNRVRIALGRCATKQEQKRASNTFLYKQTCTRNALFENNTQSDAASGRRRKRGADPPPPPGGDPEANSPDQFFNKLIDLLWQMVQFTQAVCLPSADHHPNVHHLYVASMIRLFSSPAVQLVWYPKTAYIKAMDKAMEHIFPELPDNVLHTIDSILVALEVDNTYFSILQRPTIKHMDKRDIRCAGHGKLIWGGKACCYMEEEDKKFYLYNRVSYAKL